MRVSALADVWLSSGHDWSTGTAHHLIRKAAPGAHRRWSSPRCFRSDPRVVSLDLPDLVDWMLARGCRIGEALALRHGANGDGRPLLDLEAGTWEVNATVVRVPGRGLIVQPRPKTAAGWRVVAVPAFAVRLVRGRVAAHDGVIFPAPTAGGLRDPNNTWNCTCIRQ